MSRVAAYDLTLRLSGTSAPTGQIDLGSLSELGGAMQELATRIGRAVAGHTGPGRTATSTARVVHLRLVGLRAGSTVLDIAVGDDAALPYEDGPDAEFAARFWDVIDGVSRGARPDWVSAPVAEAALRLLDAAAKAATIVEIVRRDGRQAVWRRSDLMRDPWLTPMATIGEESRAVSGRLEKVDLRDGAFRIRDDVGNAIILRKVVDAAAASQLIGRRAVAYGTPEYDSEGRLTALVEPTLALDMIPSEWLQPPRTDLEALMADVAGPDPRGLPDLTEAEADAFWSAMGR